VVTVPKPRAQSVTYISSLTARPLQFRHGSGGFRARAAALFPGPTRPVHAAA
jgi:hypothetical protein